MKIKDKHWKYATIILMIVGISSMILSNVTAMPFEGQVNSTADKSKTYEMINKGLIREATIVDLDPDKIDQSQTRFDWSFRIGVGSSGCAILQPVVNDRSPMSGFEVCVARRGTPSSDLYFGIMYPNFGNPFDGMNYMIASGISADQLPNANVFYWVGMDLKDYPLDIPSGPPSLGIVLMSTDDPDDGNYWQWGAGTGNPYPTYRPRGWDTNDEEWQNDEIDAATKDMGFVTYTTDGGGGEEVPVISITTTSWVTANIGFACLIAAAISGCKWAAIIL